MSAIGLGMRVVCIRKEPWVHLSGPEPTHYIPRPVFGKIYTVVRIETRESEVIDCPDLLLPGEVFLGFCECGGEIAFRSRNFRPLDGDAEIERLKAIAVNPAGFVELPSREPAEIRG